MEPNDDMDMEGLHELLVAEIQDLYSAEMQITDALPKVIENVSAAELHDALTEHLAVTQDHIQRLEEICESLGVDTKGETCKGMKGILEEGDKDIRAFTNEFVKDAAIIGAAQRVEHYEIAGYGNAIAHAKLMKHTKEAGLLEKTLEEEKKADSLLTKIAEKTVNKLAMEA